MSLRMTPMQQGVAGWVGCLAAAATRDRVTGMHGGGAPSVATQHPSGKPVATATRNWVQLFQCSASTNSPTNCAMRVVKLDSVFA